MNLLKKTTPWMAASLMAAASLFGQDRDRCDRKSDARSFEQGSDMLKMQAMASYNAPAGIEIRGAWDFFVTGSFIYWQPTQDNMSLGVTNTLYAGRYAQNPGTAFNGLNGNVIDMKFSYQPGFKVGVGMNVDHDNWDLFAEYTWLRGSSSQTSNGPVGGCIYPTRGLSSIDNGTPYNTATQTWRCGLDFLNLEMGRSCYVGRALTMRPTFGVRGALIRQKLYDKFSNQTITGANGNTATLSYLTVHATSQSWAVGPRVALYSNWLLGSRFRLYGNLATDILYTQYNTHSNSNFQRVNGSEAGYVTQNKVNEHHLGVLRNHVESELGIGWGSYFDNNNWYFDISAGYTWQVFFDQNMLRDFDPNAPGKTYNPNGNLYINGLTVNVRLDF